MTFEGSMICSLYTRYSIYFRMVVSLCGRQALYQLLQLSEGDLSTPPAKSPTRGRFDAKHVFTVSLLAPDSHTSNCGNLRRQAT